MFMIVVDKGVFWWGHAVGAMHLFCSVSDFILAPLRPLKTDWLITLHIGHVLRSVLFVGMIISKHNKLLWYIKVDTSAYAIPRATTTAKWITAVSSSPGFTFHVKAFGLFCSSSIQASALPTEVHCTRITSFKTPDWSISDSRVFHARATRHAEAARSN